MVGSFTLASLVEVGLYLDLLTWIQHCGTTVYINVMTVDFIDMLKTFQV